MPDLTGVHCFRIRKERESVNSIHSRGGMFSIADCIMLSP